MLQILGEHLYGEFYPSGQIISHDSEDEEHLVDLGTTKRGDRVIMNKYVYDSDVVDPHRTYTGQPVRRLFGRIQALHHGHHPLAQHRGPSRAVGDAPPGFHARIHPLHDAHKV